MVVGGMLKRSWRRQPAQPRFHSDRACRS
jgi:hypothetical protein